MLIQLNLLREECEKVEYYIKADGFLLEDEERRSGYLKVTAGLFAGFVDEIPMDAVVNDWSGYTIAPGLFDTHIHGINSYDIMDGDSDGVNEISKSILKLGVTRFLPTTLTASEADLEKAIISVAKAVKDGLTGAKSEGIFLEGPYFSEAHKGAQNPNYFRDPTVSEYKNWQKMADSQIVKIALAPERKGSMEFIEEVSKEILIGIAHTDASYDCCIEAVDAGARNYVHLFNGMSGLHHREPGVVGAALADSRAYAELICDGHHVHPAVATMALEVKQEKLVLITDCMRAGLMPDGPYFLGEFPVVMKDGIVRTDSGSLAGSTLKLIDGVGNLKEWSDKPLYEIWHLASLSPAANLGQAHRLGSIKAGKVADYVVLDSALAVKAVAVDGEIKYEQQ